VSSVKLRDARQLKQPDLVIIPMIDIMFFLLVFFMLSTLYMVEVKTVPVKLPTAVHATVDSSASLIVSLKTDGSLWLEDRQTDLRSLTAQALLEQKSNPNFAIILRADQDVPYGKIVQLLDGLKGAGVSRFGLAADSGAAES
jgi:biopolymer transport protein ExbD